MAKGKTTAKPEETTESTEVAKDRSYLKGKVNEVHKGHAEYIKEQFGVEVPPEFIFAVYSTRVAYRKTSDQYGAAKEARISAKEAAATAREEAKAAKAKEREEAKAAKDAAKAEKAAAAKAAESKPAKGKGKTSSQEALAEADAPAAKGKASAKPAAKPAAAKGKKKPF